MTVDPADGASCHIERTREPGVHGLVVTGEIDVATSPLLRQELQALVDDGRTPIVLDVSGLTFIDSSGLGAIVAARNALRERGSEPDIVLRGLPGPIRKVFEITGLTDLFAREDS